MRWTHVLTFLEDAEQTQTRDKEEWIDAISFSTDKPRMEYCEFQNGTNICIRAVQGHSYGGAINPNLFSLKQVLLNWNEHTIRTGSSSNYKSILQNGL